MAVLLEFQLKDVAELKARFGDAVVTKALNRTLDRMQSKAATLVSGDVRGFYNIQAARIKQDLSLKREYLGGQPSRVLLYSGERIGLTRFSGTVRKVEVDAISKLGKRFRTTRTAAYHKLAKSGGRTRSAHKSGALGFPAKGANANYQFFARLANGSLEVLYGPAVPLMINNKTQKKLNTMLANDMHTEFSRNMAFYLGKQVGLY